MVIRISLVLYLMYPSQGAVHQVHQLDKRSHLSMTILSLLPNANVYAAPAGKDTIVVHVQTRRLNTVIIT